MSAYSQQARNTRKTWILLFLFVGLVSALFYGLAVVYDSPILILVGLAISIGQAVVAYYFGDKLALASAGGKEVSYEEAPRIHETIQNLSKIADIPKPRIFISPDESANAFACGRDPKHASICLNQGILKLLDKNELEGVIAHELSHIKNRDILVMTVTMVLASVISLVADFGYRAMFWGGMSRDSDNDNKPNPVVIIVYIVVLILAPIISTLIQLAVSRQREYLADATAVTMTRYPEGLISALQKLYKSPVPSTHYSTATSHFFIAPPKKSFGEKVSGLMSTHPSIEDRVAALSKM